VYNFQCSYTNLCYLENNPKKSDVHNPEQNTEENIENTEDVAGNQDFERDEVEDVSNNKKDPLFIRNEDEIRNNDGDEENNSIKIPNAMSEEDDYSPVGSELDLLED